MSMNDGIDIYRFMIECSRDIVFLLDEQGRFAFLNDRVESVLGFNKQDLLGQPFSKLVYPEDQSQLGLDFYKASVTSENEWTRSIELRFKNKLDCADYRFFNIKIVNVPHEVSDAYNNIAFSDNNENRRITSYGVARDISQLNVLSNIINVNVNYDYLTGLPNRVLLEDRVRQAITHAKREGCKFVLMYIDLDGFKQVNDNYGHSAGDSLLQIVSTRMQACLRESDTLARVGGDEFMLLLPNIHREEEVKKIADKLLAVINQPFIISGCVLPITASVGIALYPDDGRMFDGLTKGADRAMYYIKHRSKNGYAFLSELPDINRQENIFNLSVI